MKKEPFIGSFFMKCISNIVFKFYTSWFLNRGSKLVWYKCFSENEKYL